jgi:N-acetylmuramoyl-L-alanine amidase
MARILRFARVLAAVLFLPFGLHALSIGGEDYLPLSFVAQRLGMRCALSPDGKDASLAGNLQSFKATLNQKGSTINGTRVWLNYPIAESKGSLYLSRLDYEHTLMPILRPGAFNLSRYHLRRIVLDPGHGGKDTGARNPRMHTNEKTFTLDVAGRVKQRLEALGYQVIFTRNSDRYVELKDRSALANAVHADLFVSIHFNSAAPNITGVETYSCTPQGAPSSSSAEPEASDEDFQPGNAHDVASLCLAYEVQRSLVSSLRAPDRAARHARFVVLEGLHCPGILVEGGFITSPTEGSRLTSSMYRQQLANAIVEGIRGYHRKILGMR